VILLKPSQTPPSLSVGYLGPPQCSLGDSSAGKAGMVSQSCQPVSEVLPLPL
jgi:hypothetical protein